MTVPSICGKVLTQNPIPLYDIHHAVDGWEILHQLIGGKHPIIYRVSTIQGGAGFRNHPQYVTPTTVTRNLLCQGRMTQQLRTIWKHDITIVALYSSTYSTWDYTGNIYNYMYTTVCIYIYILADIGCTLIIYLDGLYWPHCACMGSHPQMAIW